MNLSQKCQYAVRAVLELSKRYGQGPIPSSVIAQEQAIPQRFLEIILNELKPAGLLESRRGVQGGFLLTVKPEDLSVGRIIRLIDGPMDPVQCIGRNGESACPLQGKCSLIDLWAEAKAAVEAVYDGKSFQDLVDQEATLNHSRLVDYCI